MKNYSIIILLSLFSVISCSTYQQLIVSGEPGTEILDPLNNYQVLGVIDGAGTATFTISGDYSSEFLLARSPRDNKCIPFALDYITDEHKSTRMMMVVGNVVTYLGIGMALTILGVSDDVQRPLAIASLATVGAGVGLIWPAEKRLKEHQYRLQYKYLPMQITNQDMLFLDVTDTDENMR